MEYPRKRSQLALLCSSVLLGGGDFCQLSAAAAVGPAPSPDTPEAPGGLCAKGALCTETAEPLPPAGATGSLCHPSKGEGEQQWEASAGLSTERRPGTCHPLQPDGHREAFELSTPMVDISVHTPMFLILPKLEVRYLAARTYSQCRNDL